MPENELYHHGITGMRWGFRRFQNEDGSLTPEGELRYNQGKQKLARGKAAEMYKTKKYKAKLALKQEKQKVKDAAAIAKAAKKEQAKLNAEDRIIRKKPQNMTDEELKNEVNRLAMEIDYQKKQWQVEKGKKGPSALDKANDFFESPTGKVVSNIGTQIVTNVATKALNDMIAEKTSALKKQQIANAKKTGEEIQSRIDKNKSETISKNESTTNASKDYTADRATYDKNNYSNSGKKTAADYASEAMKSAKSNNSYKEKNKFSFGKKEKSNESYNVKDNQYGPVVSGSTKSKSNSFVDSIIYGDAPKNKVSLLSSSTVSKVNTSQESLVAALPEGNKILALPATTSTLNSDEYLKKLITGGK